MAPVIVFDLDGTLVDSVRDLADAASELVQDHGADRLGVADVATMVGEGAPLLVRRVLAYRGLDPDTPGALERFLAIYDRRLLNHTVPYDGIVEVLSLLTRIGPLAVLTNKPTSATDRLLESLGLRGFFRTVLGGDSGYPRKPDPAALRALLSPAGGLMVGDSPADADCAAAAPCPFVLAAYGFGVVKFGGGLPVHAGAARHPRELVSLVETLTLDAARMPIVMR
jgi:phosphoglycolate phosphatase